MALQSFQSHRGSLSSHFHNEMDGYISDDADSGCRTAVIGSGPNSDPFSSALPKRPSLSQGRSRSSWEKNNNKVNLTLGENVFNTPVSGELCSLFSMARVDGKAHDSSPDQTPSSATPMPGMQPDFKDTISQENQTPMPGSFAFSDFNPSQNGAYSSFKATSTRGVNYFNVDLSQNILYQRRMKRHASIDESASNSMISS